MSADWDAPQRSLADRVMLGVGRVSTTIVALAFVGVLGGCGSTADAQATMAAPERPGVDYPLDGVVSVCDRFGNRVYRYSTSIYVVDAAPSCVGSVVR